MFLVRRRADGKWWANNDYLQRRPWAAPDSFEARNWLESPEGIKPFKTKGGCKNAMQSFLYEKASSKDRRWIKHPEWFDQKFEIVPVRVEVLHG